MTAVPFGTGAYKRQVGGLPELRTVNSFMEKSPASPTGYVMLGRPGLTAFASVGTQPVRGIFSQPGTFGGDPVSVAGVTVYRNGTSLGTIPGTSRVTFAGNGLEMVIAGGGTLYRTDGVSVFPVTFPDAAGVSIVAYLGSYFVASRAGSQKFYWSNLLDGSTWQALNFSSAERDPDNLVGVSTVSDELWLFGETTTEVWYQGGDATAPFIRAQGRLYYKGCRARDTIAKADNTVFWVGNDGIVYRGDNVPLRVSDFGIEERISRSAVADLRAWGFVFEGHSFYSLTTTEGTFVYDAATGEWAEFASYNRAGWRAHVGTQIGDGRVIAGDDTTGQLWLVDRNALTDGADPIVRLFSAGVPTAGGGFSLDSVLLDMSTGGAVAGKTPVIEMRRSGDGGRTYSDWRQASAGRTGEYRRRIAWRRLGHIEEPGVVMEFRMTDAAPWRISRLRINDASGAAGR